MYEQCIFYSTLKWDFNCQTAETIFFSRNCIKFTIGMRGFFHHQMVSRTEKYFNKIWQLIFFSKIHFQNILCPNFIVKKKRKKKVESCDVWNINLITFFFCETLITSHNYFSHKTGHRLFIRFVRKEKWTRASKHKKEKT